MVRVIIKFLQTLFHVVLNEQKKIFIVGRNDDPLEVIFVIKEFIDGLGLVECRFCGCEFLIVLIVLLVVGLGDLF